ncbi:MAG: DUF3489 domain-containing protein [Hyphomicrobiaceae bacterium]
MIGAPGDENIVTAKPDANARKADSPMRTRSDSKQAQLIDMLRRPEGVTIDEIVKALKWQAHTVRGSMSGALKKKLGLTIESEKEGERGCVYRIAG